METCFLGNELINTFLYNRIITELLSNDLLTLYHTILSFNDPKPFENILKKEKMLETSIFSFSYNVFYPSKNKFQFFKCIYLQLLSNWLV